jgi:hypothetical protein
VNAQDRSEWVGDLLTLEILPAKGWQLQWIGNCNGMQHSYASAHLAQVIRDSVGDAVPSSTQRDEHQVNSAADLRRWPA